MKKKIARVLVGFAVGFAALFGVRLLYGFRETPTDSAVVGGRFDNNNSDWSGDFFANSRKNYSSGKEYKGGVAVQMPTGGDQKFEKVARLTGTSTDFPTHERSLRTAITTNKAVIQAEQSSGLVGHRYLHLSIGVPAPAFEPMLDQVRTIGTLTSIQVNKTDKTNEYKDLNVKRVSLEKSRDALIALKGRAAGAKIDELINLEQKILEAEENIQKLGVRLGEFDAENEFVTIQFALSEVGAPKKISFGYRAIVAFQWTVKWYLAILAMLLLASICALVLVTMADKFRGLIDGTKSDA